MKNHKKKKRVVVLLALFVSVFIFASFFYLDPVFGQETTSETTLGYVPLESLPGLENQDISLSSYLNRMFAIFIGAASVLAVLMIVIAGFMYLTSGGSESARKSAKEKMTGAVLGLLLAISSVLILETVNPDLLEFNLSLRNIKPGESQPPREGAFDPGKPWGNDDDVRNLLTQGGNSLISVNKKNCEFVGQTNCTSLFGLSLTAINGLRKLEKECDCTIQITAGTEFWLHSEGTQHRPGGAVVDISSWRTVNKYITGSFERPSLGCFEKITKNGVTFQWEAESCPGSSGDHWHVIF